MATNPTSDEEIVLETNDKIEKDDSNDNSLFHLLEGRWTFWYTHRPTTLRNAAVNYDSCLKKLGLLKKINFIEKKNIFFFFKVHLVQLKNFGAIIII